MRTLKSRISATGRSGWFCEWEVWVENSSLLHLSTPRPFLSFTVITIGICVCICAHKLGCICRGQKIAFRSWFFVVWVLWVLCILGLNLGRQVSTAVTFFCCPSPLVPPDVARRSSPAPFFPMCCMPASHLMRACSTWWWRTKPLKLHSSPS